MSKEEFKMWFRMGSKSPIAIKGHTFSVGKDGMVKVDGGKFVYEEALQLVLMLNSKNPVSQLNATMVIWERNGILRFVVVALVAILAVAGLILVRR